MDAVVNEKPSLQFVETGVAILLVEVEDFVEDKAGYGLSRVMGDMSR